MSRRPTLGMTTTVQLTRLALSNFRNYAQLDLDPAPGLNMFIGSNAQGKVESARSDRDARAQASRFVPAEMPISCAKAWNLPSSVVMRRCARGSCTSAARSCGPASARVRPTRSTERACATRAFLGSIRVVTFVPADLHSVGGPPALRRALINIALAQDDRRYYHELARYGKALQQKNAMLRGTVDSMPNCSRSTTIARGAGHEPDTRAQSFRARACSRSERIHGSGPAARKNSS